jgi:hypothetical protein
MKKALLFFFAFLYLLTVSGATFNLHFCGNSLERISFAGFGHKGCCCGVKMKDKNCCKDKQVSLKSAKEQQRFEIISLPVSSPQASVSQVPEFHSAFKSGFVSIVQHASHAPPETKDDSGLIIFNRVLRI